MIVEWLATPQFLVAASGMIWLALNLNWEIQRRKRRKAEEIEEMSTLINKASATMSAKPAMMFEAGLKAGGVVPYAGEIVVPSDFLDYVKEESAKHSPFLDMVPQDAGIEVNALRDELTQARHDLREKDRVIQNLSERVSVLEAEKAAEPERLRKLRLE